MIELQANRWLHFEDLAQEIPGRDDPLELSEACYRYLAERPRPRRSEGEAWVIDLRARAALAAAWVRAAVAPRIAPSGKEQDTIKRQEATINRLLAFVPARAGEVPENRLREIGHEVIRISQDLFRPPAPLSLFLERETEPDTLACHRITVSVPHRTGKSVASLVRAEVALRKHLAAYLSKPEFSAVRVLVQYEPVRA